MRTKLELKHLSAYLPYGVRTNIGRYSETNVELDLGFLISYEIDAFKPILRPLSELVIDEKLIEDFIGLGNWCNAYDEYIDHWYPDASYAQQAPYVIFEYFLVNHYDVFGLIENDLAIDVNSIK
jgi:hypothetical protein